MSPASDRPAISRRGRERRIMVNRIGVAGSIGIRGNQGRSKLHLSRESFSGADSHGSNSSTRPPKAYHALKVSGTSNHRPRMCPPGIPQTAFPEDVEARPSRVVGNPEVGPRLQGLLRRSRAAYPHGCEPRACKNGGRETGLSYSGPTRAKCGKLTGLPAKNAVVFSGGPECIVGHPEVGPSRHCGKLG